MPTDWAVRARFGGTARRGSRVRSRDALKATRPNLSAQARAVASTTINAGMKAAGNQNSPRVATQPHGPAALQPATVLMQAMGTAANNPSKTIRRPLTASATSSGPPESPVTDDPGERRRRRGRRPHSARQADRPRRDPNPPGIL